MFVLAAALLCAGCANPRERQLSPGANIPAGESAVFGDIAATGLPGLERWVSVIDTRRSIPVLEHRVKENGGPFFWHLPPGPYAVFDLHTGASMEGRAWRIYGEFQVDSAGQVIYVGCLHLVFDSDRMTSSVSSEFEKATQLFKSTYPRVVGTPIKRLLKFERTP
jgi:hypothetical protein